MTGEPEQEDQSAPAPQVGSHGKSWWQPTVARNVALVVGAALALSLFAIELDRVTSWWEWLCLRHSLHLFVALSFAAVSLWAGHTILTWILRRTLPLMEHALYSFLLGVLAFHSIVVTFGYLGLLGSWFFPVPPLALLAFGARRGIRFLRRLIRHLPGTYRGGSPWLWSSHAFAGLGLVAIYVTTLIPSVVGYDESWYHLPIAEHYAALGAIRSFREGWFMGAYPHFCSVLYTWVFCAPWCTYYDKVLIAVQIDLVFFVATMVSVPLIARHLVKGFPRMGFAVAIFWCFPAVVLYGPSGSSNWGAAAFAATVPVLLLRTLPSLNPRWAALLSIAMGMTLLTRYSAVIAVAFPILAVTAWTLVTGIRVLLRQPPQELRQRFYWAFLVCALVGLAVTAPHWLKNALFYHDPFYPSLYRRLPLTPFTATAAELQKHFWFATETWHAPHTWAGVWQSLQVPFTFSFRQHEWPAYTYGRPVFGSLFTLSLFVLPFLKGARRIWLVHVGVLVGVLLWYWIHHQDRYLTVLLPWMAAAAAATGYLAWRQSGFVRPLLVGLLGLQALQTFPLYARARFDPRLVTPFRWDFAPEERRESPAVQQYNDFRVIREVVPPDGKVLIHDTHLKLGVGRPTVSDALGWQGGICYGELRTPRKVHETLRDMGVTHIHFLRDSREFESLAGDLVFYEYVLRYATETTRADVVRLPEQPPPTRERSLVLVATCAGRYPAGLHPMSALTQVPLSQKKRPRPAPLVDLPRGNQRAFRRLAKRADYLVLETRCYDPGTSLRKFCYAAKRGRSKLYYRCR